MRRPIPMIRLPESFRGAPLLGTTERPPARPIPKAKPGINWDKVAVGASVVGAVATVANFLRV